MPEAKKRLYAAYGSNLNLRQMVCRCPTAKVTGTAVMRNWRLVFNGVATIERYRGGRVPVLVWELQPEDEAALDRYEGWPSLYRKETVRMTLNGKRVRAMVYIMNHGRQSPPNFAYYNTIREGYESAGFDINTLRDAARRSSGKGEKSMNSTVREQILAIRDTRETNMFDTNMVQRIAMREEFYELVRYLEDHKREYSLFILTGEAREENEK
ncbi:MAG: DUF5049 domain-containing protein [Treponema sp.]|nr:DUF5049 domain-containing protein [Treponema sp.]